MGGEAVETKLERLLLRPAEAAEILGDSRSKLDELVAARKLTVGSLGRWQIDSHTAQRPQGIG